MTVHAKLPFMVFREIAKAGGAYRGPGCLETGLGLILGSLLGRWRLHQPTKGRSQGKVRVDPPRRPMHLSFPLRNTAFLQL